MNLFWGCINMKFFKFPYTNFHELNLDWIIETLKENTDFTKKVYEEVSHLNETIETVANKVVTDMLEAGKFDPSIERYIDGRLTGIEETANSALEGVKKYDYLDTLRGKKILIVGDSNSDENYNSGKINKHWTQSFKEKLAKIDVTVTNRSVAGKQIDWAKTVITEENAASRYYDIIIIMLGTNNYGHATPIENFNSTLKEIPVTPQVLNGAHIVIVSPPKRTLFESKETPHVPLVVYMRSLYAYSQKIGAQFVDCWGKQPVINIDNNYTLNKYYYDSKLHFGDAYAPIFAEWIIGKLVSGESDTIGDYYETYPGRFLKQFFTNSNNFEINENGSFLRVGTRSITFNIIGSLKTYGSNTTGIQPIANLPVWAREQTSLSYLHCHLSVINRGDRVETQIAQINNSEGKLYVTVDGLSTSDKLYRIYGTIHPMLNTDYMLPEYPKI